MRLSFKGAGLPQNRCGVIMASTKVVDDGANRQFFKWHAQTCPPTLNYLKNSTMREVMIWALMRCESFTFHYSKEDEQVLCSKTQEDVEMERVKQQTQLTVHDGWVEANHFKRRAE